MHEDCSIMVNVFEEQSNSIVKMKLEEVVERITARELPGRFEIEAAKALAVAIRTSVVKKLKIFDGAGWGGDKGADISTSMSGCKELTDFNLLKEVVGSEFNNIYELACKAAEDTSGLIVTCGGRPISADYHLACGGGTENSEDVLGNTIMYFRKVLCKYCSDSPYWESTVDIPVKELEEKLNTKALKGGSVSGPEIEGVIEDVYRDDTGRVRRIKVGGRSFTGGEIKKLLGLNSSRFGWDPVVIRFKVRGHGSGLGLCLYGANTMAKSGKNYEEILNYYYTNIAVENIDIAGSGNPLKGKLFAIDPGHGGESEGDEAGPSGLREKDVNLYIALRLAEYLKKNGAEVKLTRDGDLDVPLPKRVEMINGIRPNFVISIHQNSFFAPGVSGTEVYFYRGDCDGEKMGRIILDNIVKTIGTVNRGNRNADFYILRESKVSSVVIECMYITNPEEERKLKDNNIKDDIAKSICRGIMDYYGI